MRWVALVAVVAAGCGRSTPRASDAVTVAPRPVPAPVIEVVGEAPIGIARDVAPIEIAIAPPRVCVRLDGKVHCADGDDSVPVVQWPVVGGIDDATSVALGRDFGCIATRRGTVHCFGSNFSGQLGARLRDEQSKDAVAVVGISSARRVFAGDAHVCAVLADGTVQCWGENSNGATGGSTSYAPAARELVVPNAVRELRDVLTVASTYSSTCALTRTGDVHCWGTSVTEEQTKAQGHINESPFRMAALARSEDLAAGSGAYCAVRANDVTCLGSTYALGRGAAIPGARQVRIGDSHACALTRDSRVWCWGYNHGGELARDEDPRHGDEPYAPAVVAGLPSVRDLAVGGSLSCAIASSDEAWCWGTWPYSGKQSQRVERAPVRLRLR